MTNSTTCSGITIVYAVLKRDFEIFALLMKHLGEDSNPTPEQIYCDQLALLERVGAVSSEKKEGTSLRSRAPEFTIQCVLDILLGI